jgi:acyl carrier protein
MSHETILARLQPELIHALGVDASACVPGARLATDLGAESIDLVDLTFRIEKTFHITIPEGELFEDRHGSDLTVDQVAAYIATRLPG